MTARRSSTPKSSRQQGSVGRREHFPVRRRRPLPRSHRGRSATLEPGYWRLEEARFYASGVAAGRARHLPARDDADARAGRRKLRDARDRAVLAAVVLYRRSPRMPAWPPPAIDCSIISCWRSPSISCAMVLLAAAVSLRFFRFGGVQKIVLGRHRRGLSALRHGEDHRRLEQGRDDGAR